MNNNYAAMNNKYAAMNNNYAAMDNHYADTFLIRNHQYTLTQLTE